MIINKQFNIITEQHELFIDITKKIEKIVADTKIVNGQVTVYSMHTTLGIKVMEMEDLLKADLKNFLYRLAPMNGVYYHNNTQIRQVPDNERLNAHSHIWSFVIDSSSTIPIINGMVYLGKWQKIVAIECDAGRERGIVVQVSGE